MIYLSGAVRPELAAMGAGYLLQPNMGNMPPDLSSTPWAADNGCFSQGDTFSLGRYISWLEKMAPWRSTCLFATAPDVLCDAEATWQRSQHILPVLRDLGYKAALVAQDGIEDMVLDYTAFDVLFIGGSTAWKLSDMAFQVAADAMENDKEAHMGRVNTRQRMRAARDMGCTSVDGTFLAFGPDKNLPRLRRWIDEIKTQPSLWVA